MLKKFSKRVHIFNKSGTKLRRAGKFKNRVCALSILISFGFLGYGLSDARGNIYFPSANLILENFGQDDRFPDSSDQPKAIPFDSAFSGKPIPPRFHSFKDLLPLPFPVFLSAQKEILRC